MSQVSDNYESLLSSSYTSALLSSFLPGGGGVGHITLGVAQFPWQSIALGAVPAVPSAHLSVSNGWATRPSPPCSSAPLLCAPPLPHGPPCRRRVGFAAELVLVLRGRVAWGWAARKSGRLSPNHLDPLGFLRSFCV